MSNLSFGSRNFAQWLANGSIGRSIDERSRLPWTGRNSEALGEGRRYIYVACSRQKGTFRTADSKRFVIELDMSRKW
jgi:hypothetical protein